MSRTSFQYQILKQGALLSKVSVWYPNPGPDEICIRPKVIAINSLDWKKRDYGVMVESWPTVLGLDAAGTIEAVGESVEDFKAGDEVFSLCGLDNRKGAFQEVITVPSYFAAKKPASFTFEEASSLPICYLTSVAAIIEGLHVPLPHLDPTRTSPLTSVLVLGGSSGVGCSAIQLLRLALPSATILTTSSAKHHDHLISLGADKCFERSAQEDISAIKAATIGGVGVDAILDPVQAGASQPSIFSVFNPTGPKVYSQVMTGQNVAVPEGVSSAVVFGRQVFGAKGGMNAIPGLVSLIESGKFKLPNKIEIVGGGLEGIELGLEKSKKGVSGVKLVVSM